MIPQDDQTPEVECAPKFAGGKDRRRQQRNEVEGAVFWSYASNPRVPQYEATLLDSNRLGLGLISDRPLRESSVVRLSVKSLWPGDRHATVMRCERVDAETYKVGLLYTVRSCPL